MSTETKAERQTDTGIAFEPWQAGVAGGLIGSFGFGLIMAYVISAPVLEVAIPNMYGIEATPAEPAAMIGWVIHMAHGAVLGVVFAAALRIDAISEFASDTMKTGIVGLVYGVLTWVGLAVILMPIWLEAVGFAGAPSLPNFSELSLLGHAVFGALLGISYDVLVAE